MLSVFSKPRELPSSPLSPCGSKRRLLEHSSLTPEEEEYVQQVLDSLYTSLPRRQHAYITEHYLGGGANAIAYLESLTHGLASDGDVSVFFAGTLENNPEDLEDAQYILEEYRRAFDGLGAAGDEPVMAVLTQLRGPWAFVIYHRSHGRIVAARDAAGEQPLCYGTTLLSEGLLFASDRALLEGECGDADDFPPGAIFVSDDFSTEGKLMSYLAGGGDPMAAKEQQQQQEALCRVESSTALPRAASTSEIAAQ